MSEIGMTIQRVRRAMPRNADVMAVCDALEAMMRKLALLTLATPAHEAVANRQGVEVAYKPVIAGNPKPVAADRDRRAYMRRKREEARRKDHGNEA